MLRYSMALPSRQKEMKLMGDPNDVIQAGDIVKTLYIMGTLQTYRRERGGVWSRTVGAEPPSQQTNCITFSLGSTDAIISASRMTDSPSSISKELNLHISWQF